MRKSSAAALLAIFLTAAWIRLSPLLSFGFWGADIGEYYVLLRRLATTGHLSTSYAGWGITYPYFPGMFFAQGAVVGLSPIGVPAATNLIVPLLGALAVAPAYLIGAQVGREGKVGLFVAALVAVAFPHAYSTSHTAPSTVGSLLVFAALLLFLRLGRDSKAALPVGLVTAALVVTHHLSSYFLILMVLGTLVFRGLLRPVGGSAGLRRELAYAVYLVLVTFAFWFGYATTFRDGILHDVNVRPWYLPLLAFPALVVAMAATVLARRRVSWRYRPAYPSLRRAIALYALTVVSMFGLLAALSVGTVPGTTISLSPIVILAFAPLCVLLALSAMGRKFADFLRDGSAMTAWLLALLASIGVGAIVAPRVIIPYRHIEFLLLPLAFLGAVGLFRVLDLADVSQRRRAVAVGACGVLLLASAALAIPPPEMIAQWQEGIRPAAIDMAVWTQDHIDGLLAADHRASSLAFGFGGVDATWDRTRLPFLAETFTDSLPGLVGVEVPSGTRDVAYVWIDEDIRRGVQLYPWEPAVPMPPRAIAKFSESPFVKIFDNGYGQIYRIAWDCDGSC